ncbi:MAG: TonB-dependent receptor [Deltaproteobacteria bacterium]|nr:TonB-dependent receptor [Deltaproteobacteria bacterium]
MTRAEPDTHQKAFQVNLDPGTYGTFAEIGAGQEVARWFFRVGGASGTVAKTISAYDMAFSDAIYGPCERYVSRRRLHTMLDTEFELLQARLAGQRGTTTRFFAFSDTVAARSYSRPDGAHGWMGIKFQTEPLSEPSQIIIHVRLLDRENVAQQEALGMIGVNLIHGSLTLHREPKALVSSLLDNLSADRVEVDMIKFSGSAFEAIDNRLMSLELVQLGLTNAAMIAADGEVVQPAEVLHKKPILVARGSFRPVTNAMIDMLNCSIAQFVQEPQVQGEEIVILMEMTLNNLVHAGAIDPKDFLARADTLGALGHTVLISNFGQYYRLAAYLFTFTKKMIGIATGVPTLKEIFDEKYYEDLPGGILESFGRLFENDLKVYAYPQCDTGSGAVISAANLLVKPHLRHLYAYLYENRFIESLRGYDEALLPVLAQDVLDRIQARDSSWESMVPKPVGRIIRERGLWGFEP